MQTTRPQQRCALSMPCADGHTPPAHCLAGSALLLPLHSLLQQPQRDRMQQPVVVSMCERKRGEGGRQTDSEREERGGRSDCGLLIHIDQLMR